MDKGQASWSHGAEVNENWGREGGRRREGVPPAVSFMDAPPFLLPNSFLTAQSNLTLGTEYVVGGWDTSQQSISGKEGGTLYKHKLTVVIGGLENVKEMRGLYETSADKKWGDVRRPSRIRSP